MITLELTTRQRSTIAAAVTLLAGIFILFVVGAFFVLLGAFVSFFSSVLLPLVVAGILALMLKPYYEWLLRGVRRPTYAVLLVFLSMIIPVAGLLWFFGAMVAQQVTALVQNVPVWLDSLEGWIRTKLPALQQFWSEHDLGSRMRTAVQEQGGEMARGLAVLGGNMLSAGANVFRAVTGFFGWVVLPVYLGFFLMAKAVSRKRWEGLLPFLKPETRKDLIYLSAEFVDIVVAFFRGQVVIALSQGVLYAIGFAFVGLQYGLLIGLLLGLLNIVPYLGSLIGLGLALPLAFFQADGGWNVLIGVGVTFTVVQMIEAYLLTPRIMGSQTGLHPVAIIFAMFFWGTALGGILGMILAVPLTAFLVVFWRLLKDKYIKEMV